MSYCEFDCVCDLDCNCNFVKDFEGIYGGSGIVYIANLQTGEILEQIQDILLEIKKIANQVYFAKFTELAPNPGLTFSCVGTQTTENKYLIQSGTGGLNSFYFDITEGFDILNVNFSSPNINGESFGASIKFYRK